MTSQTASDLSYFVLQKRRERGEIGPCALDSVNQRLYPLPSQVVQREAFMADRIVACDEATWNQRVSERRQGKLA